MSGFVRGLNLRTTISAEALQRLVPELWGKPRIASYLISLTEEIQELEVAIFGVIESRILDSAIGAQLRILGSIVGQKNFGWDDESYRAAIRARIRALRSTGRLLDVLEVVRLLTPPPFNAFTVKRGVNASIVVQWLSQILPNVIDAALRDILKITRPGGVKLLALIPGFDPSFTYKHVGEGDIPALAYDHSATFGTDSGGRYLHVVVI